MRAVWRLVCLPSGRDSNRVPAQFCQNSRNPRPVKILKAALAVIIGLIASSAVLLSGELSGVIHLQSGANLEKAQEKVFLGVCDSRPEHPHTDYMKGLSDAIVSKRVMVLKDGGFAFQDVPENRPLILIIEAADFKYFFRFRLANGEKKVFERTFQKPENGVNLVVRCDYNGTKILKGLPGQIGVLIKEGGEGWAYSGTNLADMGLKLDNVVPGNYKLTLLSQIENIPGDKVTNVPVQVSQHMEKTIHVTVSD